ncbi:MAG: DUF4340 domain-containing protein [Nitrosomonas sp.]|uniref:DUF4340 domain-containing protein n=1 Tax=Nitrosomonas sp. TaxID=42353 RepID=UPI0025F3EB76|nr:DUF4340 domain-containing protein [Nitrosomonas sp.]MBY0475475.1 DUF4340 domain-containing protein [Nitrosomonas sp.]
MTHHSRLNLIMFATIAGLMAFLYFRPQSDAIQEYPISTTTIESVQSVRILNKQQEIVLVQSNDQWRMIEPIQARADEKKIGEILEILKASSYQRFALENLDRFNLDRPYLQFHVDNEYFGFGVFSPTTNQQYVVTNDFVYLISPRYALAMSLTVSDLINSELLAPDEIPVRFEMDRWVVEFQNDSWRTIQHYSSDGFDDEVLTWWIQLWQTARAGAVKLEGELDSGFVERGVIQISMRNGNIVKFNMLQNEYSIVLRRMPEKIGYYFPIEVGQQLIDPSTMLLN